MLMTWEDKLIEDVMILEWCLAYVLKPESKNVVSSKWISKIKYVADRSKERLVAIGFYQKEEINFGVTKNIEEASEQGNEHPLW